MRRGITWARRGQAACVWGAAVTAMLLGLGSGPARAQGPLILQGNLDVLHAAMPGTADRFLGSTAPGGLVLAGEKVDVRLALKKDDGAFALEIQEITTRDPDAKVKGAYTDTAGDAPLIALEGKPVTVPVTPAFTDAAEAEAELKDLPLPARFGTYALVLVHKDKRQFVGTLARVPQPRADGTVENVPIFGEGQFFDGNSELRVQQYARMGIRGWRSEIGWNEAADGALNWDGMDKLFAAAEKGGCRIMITLGGHPPWTRPFHEPTPASGWHAKSGGYWGTGDWLCHPSLYERYGKWITAFCQRYWKDGKGALWGLENYNEPWEGGGISGWARDCLEYRKIQKLIADSARVVSPDIKLLAASSIMNTEDKLYSDGTAEFDQYVDIFTDHYVVPAMCYGPMVAKARGKESMETETWVVNAEYLLPLVICQFMAAGQARIAPWHPRVLFDSVPGMTERTNPTPVATATAALNYLLTGKRFEKVVFHDHLPWVFQFGKDDDPDGMLVVFGRLLMTWGEVRERPMAQVEAVPGGTLTIDNADGLLRFRDMAANPVYEGQKRVTLPMSIYPTYIQCAQGPAAAAARLQAARIEGKRPVEILPRDFDRIPAAGTVLRVAVHNCLNRPVKGTLTVTAPAELRLEAGARELELAAGQTQMAEFTLTAATVSEANAYPFSFVFASDAGNAEYREVLNAAVAPKGTRTIDGNLDDWRDVPGVTVVSGKPEIDPTELARRPWLALSEKAPKSNFAEFKLAWDENFLYIAARVNDATPNPNLPSFAARDENSFFHTAASDQQSPYKEFLEAFLAKNPAAPYKSFADVPFVYCRSPETFIPFRRDRLHVALDVTDDWHDLAATTDRVPLGLHAWPDTDYEYSCYVYDGTKAELWRQLAPGVPRIHDFPRQLRGAVTTGLVPGVQCAARLDGNTYTYEVAIPKEELKTLKLAAGTTFGLMLRAGDDKNAHADYGLDKAVTKVNGLSLHPYWERSSNCGVRWTLVE